MIVCGGKEVCVSILSNFGRINREANNGLAVAIVLRSIHFSGNISRILKHPRCIGLLIGCRHNGFTVRMYSRGSSFTLRFGTPGTSAPSSIAAHGLSLLITARGFFAFPRIPTSGVTFFTLSNRCRDSRHIVVFSTGGKIHDNAINGHNPGTNRNNHEHEGVSSIGRTAIVNSGGTL